MRLFLIAVLLLSPVCAQGQNKDASLEETFDWIKAKLKDSSLIEFPNQVSIYFYHMEFDGCQLKWREDFNDEHWSGRGGKYSKLDEVITDLSDMRLPVEVERYSKFWRVRLSTFNGKRTVKLHRLTTSPSYMQPPHNKQDVKIPFALFYLDNEDMAQRVANAFTHAIQLCGGKKEPF